jgi:5S rRNA maturation endonuclease (ribonuclease M5)
MSNVYAFTYPPEKHYQVPRALDKWLTSIKFDELKLLLYVHSLCEHSSQNQVTLSNDEICQNVGLHRTVIARARQSLIDYKLLAVKLDKRKYTYFICTSDGTPAPDRRTIGKVSLDKFSSEALASYAKYFLSKPFDVKGGVQATCPMPNHNDSTASLFFRTEKGSSKKDEKGLWVCRGCKADGSAYTLMKIVRAQEGKEIDMTKAFRLANIKLREFDPTHKKRLMERVSSNIESPYVDEDGLELYQVVRRFGLKNKTIIQHLNPLTGRYEKGMGGARNVLFNLPDVIQADVVFVVEGEPDAKNLDRFALKDDAGRKVAVTTNALGAGNFTDEHADSLVGKRCILLGDNDEPGVAHVRDVAAKLEARRIVSKTLVLPLRYKDVSDYLAENHVGSLVNLEGGEWLDSEGMPVEI